MVATPTSFPSTTSTHRHHDDWTPLSPHNRRPGFHAKPATWMSISSTTEVYFRKVSVPQVAPQGHTRLQDLALARRTCTEEGDSIGRVVGGLSMVGLSLGRGSLRLLRRTRPVSGYVVFFSCFMHCCGLGTIFGTRIAQMVYTKKTTLLTAITSSSVSSL